MMGLKFLGNLTLEKTKVASEIFATWIGLFALLGGGLFSLVQYLENESGERVKTTLGFLDRHNSVSLLTARRSLLQSWNSRETELFAVLKADDFNEGKLGNFVAEVLKKDGTYEPVILLVDFYDALDVCVARKICDEEVALDLFQQDAKVFWFLHKAYFEGMRKDRRDPGFAKNLETLVKRVRKG